MLLVVRIPATGLATFGGTGHRMLSTWLQGFISQIHNAWKFAYKPSKFYPSIRLSLYIPNLYTLMHHMARETGKHYLAYHVGFL